MDFNLYQQPRGPVTNRHYWDRCLTRVGNTMATACSAPSWSEAGIKHVPEDGEAGQARASACGAHKALGLPQNYRCRPPLNSRRARIQASQTFPSLKDIRKGLLGPISRAMNKKKDPRCHPRPCNAFQGGVTPPKVFPPGY